MSIPSPNLDDRTFEQLLDEAKALIARSNSGWTDLSPSDPGTVLLEAFAHLTSMLIYRVNRLPEKVYVELLRLIGVKLAPPTAARTRLRFSLAKAASQATTIPAGTRVTIARAGGDVEPPVFLTTAAASIPAGETAVEGVLALHCVQVNGELAGLGTGLPRQSVKVAHVPIIAPVGDELDLVVGVEALPQELDERVPALSFDGKTYRLWQAADNFTAQGPDSFCYIADRINGRITFAPAVRALDDDGHLQFGGATLARVPAAGREIRVWYRYGGGEAGNLAANSLVVLRDPIRGVLVTNSEPAVGGAAAETLENAMLRGPEDMHSLRRAVTARDFESVALRSSGAVVRAKAVTKSEVWKHAAAGTVEVLLVPMMGNFEQRGDGVVNRDALRALETDDVLERIRATLELRQPMAIQSEVKWVNYKSVQVLARVVVHRGEDVQAVRARVLSRLHLTVNPLPTPLQRGGWRFGEPLRASHVYDIVLGEPGVSYVDQVRFRVDEVPGENVAALVVDPFQPSTWYAGGGAILFRSLNDGDSWEPVGLFDGQTVDAVAPSPDRPGQLACCTRTADGSARIHVSPDCGETWRQVAELAFPVNDLAWMEQGGVSVLLMACDKGLYELALERNASPLQLMVDAQNPAQGFYAVVAFIDGRGGSNVAVAARQMGGIYLSRSGGKTETFARIHPGQEDIRVLAVQRLGVSSFLWVGITTAGNETGKGCLRWELPSSPQSVESPEGWRPFLQKWQGGSCRALAFDGLTVHAGTHFAGIASIDGSKPDAGWDVSSIHCGLPMRGSEKLFAPVLAVAAQTAAGGSLLMAAGAKGVYRSDDQGQSFSQASSAEFTDKVALPHSWLFCSGAHDVTVLTADEAERD